MKNIGHPHRRQAAFTLIELIVVIAIIGILAALIIPVIGAVNKKKQIALAQAQLEGIEVAIDGYKTKLGFYPPDNTNNVVTNQLYFELLGTTNNGAGSNPSLWVTMDGSAQIDNTGAENISSFFNVSGFANTSARAHSDDQGAAASTFLNNLTPNQIGQIDPQNKPLVKILVCPIPWPSDRAPVMINNPTLNPWCYDSSHPTNNTGSYDLWVDLVIRGKTNRVCNWSPQPIQL